MPRWCRDVYNKSVNSLAQRSSRGSIGLLYTSCPIYQLIYNFICPFFHSSVSSVIHFSMYPTAQLFVLRLSIAFPLRPTNYSTVRLLILLSSVHPVIQSSICLFVHPFIIS